MSSEFLWRWQAWLRAHWPGSAVRAFLYAWGRELLASLPVAVQRSFRPGNAPRRFNWPLTDAAGPPSLADCQPERGARGILDLPDAAVLLHSLTLPVAAARDLHHLIRYELDRFTPFNADQVYYAVRREPDSDARPRVTLALVRREFLDQCLSDCEALGLELEAVDVRDTSGAPMGINLLPAQYRLAGNQRGRVVTLALSLSCVVLVIASALLWLHNRESALSAMQAEVQQLRQQAGEVAALRSVWDNSQGAMRFLIERRTRQPGRAQLLSELTGCLPSDTWLQSLEIDVDGQVDMAGLSARASGLIARIKDCPHLAEPQFQGVIQPDPASGRERFYLRARVRGEAGHAALTDRS